MSETRTFPLRTVLTVTTGRLLTKPRDGHNGIQDLYEILGFMTDDQPYTHQLPRFAEECAPWLYRWFPILETVNYESLDELDALVDSKGKDGVDEWLEKIERQLGVSEFAVGKIPRDDHQRKHAYDELVQMRGRRRR